VRSGDFINNQQSFPLVYISSYVVSNSYIPVIPENYKPSDEDQITNHHHQSTTLQGTHLDKLYDTLSITADLMKLIQRSLEELLDDTHTEDVDAAASAPVDKVLPSDGVTSLKEEQRPSQRDVLSGEKNISPVEQLS